MALALMVGIGVHAARSEIASWKNVRFFLVLGVLFVPAGLGYLWLWGHDDPLRYLKLGQYAPGRQFIYLGYMCLALALIGLLLGGVRLVVRRYRRWRGHGA